MRGRVCLTTGLPPRAGARRSPDVCEAQEGCGGSGPALLPPLCHRALRSAHPGCALGQSF